MKFTLRHIYLWEILCAISFFLPFFISFGLAFILFGVQLNWIEALVLLAMLLIGCAAVFLFILPIAIILYAFGREMRNVDFDRTFFPLKNTPTDASHTIDDIEHRLRKRRFSLQRNFDSSDKPEIIATRQTFHVLHDFIDSTILVYQVDLLDLPTYNRICANAKRVLHELPAKRRHFKRLVHKKTFVVCVVADKIADGLTAKIKQLVESERDEILCCAVDTSQRHVIINGKWFRPLSELHYSQRLVADIVMGRYNRRLPRFGNPNYIAERTRYLETLESQRLTDVLKEGGSCSVRLIRENFHNKRMVRRLQDGELKAIHDFLFYRKGKRVSQINCLPDFNDERRVMLLPVDKWEWNYPVRNPMSKADKNELHIKIESYLQQNGFSFYYEEDSE